MLTLSLIGIGCGDPQQLTLAAIAAINAADLVLIPRKGTAKSDLADLRRTISAEALNNDRTRIAEFDLPVRDAGEANYRKGVDDWHDAVAATWSQEIARHLGGEGRVALLIWGDPSLYDSSLRIARRLDPLPSIEVIPGITSIQALCAAHALPLNEIGEPFLVTTGRRLRVAGLAAGRRNHRRDARRRRRLPDAGSGGLEDLVGRLSRHARSDPHGGRAGGGRPSHCRRAPRCA
ncbi:precorrin-6A synthase [Bradyrhizobium sp. JR3.5]